jgi:hypothetical protein
VQQTTNIVIGFRKFRKTPYDVFVCRERVRKARGKPLKKSKDWILEKKERRRKKGIETRPDSKFTGRKRTGKW